MARSDEKTRIERLIAEMTLEEKLGQLTMLSGELVQTGPPPRPSPPKRSGKAASAASSICGARERVREVQRHAGGRLAPQIPLFFCLDVLYGLRTFFPIPFGESCAFDPGLWERTARVAAQECAVEGIDSELLSHDRRGARSTLGPDGRRPRRG